MRSHGPTLLRLVGTARGRAAEYFGEGHLESDRWVRTVGIPGRADRWYERQDSTTRRYLDAFTGGMNAWAEEHAVALRVAGLGEGRLFEQYWEMMGAEDLASFEEALGRPRCPCSP